MPSSKWIERAWNLLTVDDLLISHGLPFRIIGNVYAALGAVSPQCVPKILIDAFPMKEVCQVVRLYTVYSFL
jgi:hypothetical protein